MDSSRYLQVKSDPVHGISLTIGRKGTRRNGLEQGSCIHCGVLLFAACDIWYNRTKQKARFFRSALYK